ncbi:hypothetical protein [Devosia aurantiaca]|uniref:Uncharacterized protein n=1 Tax=Devosia aurantiaca TaxID=2714858 RepID=A0A6M1SQ02_9HYPH|nr:hypothetical protein [Devosia aurantiaca]NGP16543.1 hypothetical protein [Devosia aurantiaca]
MGALIVLFLTGLVVVGIWKIFTDPDARTRYAEEFNGAPFESLLVMAWVACILVFFWGIFVPVFGQVEVPILGRDMQIWSLGGIGAFAGWLIWMAAAQYKSKRR